MLCIVREECEPKYDNASDGNDKIIKLENHKNGRAVFFSEQVYNTYFKAYLERTVEGK